MTRKKIKEKEIFSTLLFVRLPHHPLRAAIESMLCDLIRPQRYLLLIKEEAVGIGSWNFPMGRCFSTLFFVDPKMGSCYNFQC